MRVRMAEHYGMCFGVRDAVDLALDLTRQGPLTILGDLVHNPDVVARMDAAGAVRAPPARGGADAGRAADRPRHVRPREAGAARAGPGGPRRHLPAGDARRTWPCASWSPRGDTPSSSARPKHVEVRGLVGDLDDCTIILDESDLAQLDERLRRDPTARLGVVAQTTQPLERVTELVEALQAAIPRRGRAFHRHRLSADQGPPAGAAGTGRRDGRGDRGRRPRQQQQPQTGGTGPRPGPAGAPRRQRLGAAAGVVRRIARWSA